jgi:hypothetical protein
MTTLTLSDQQPHLPGAHAQGRHVGQLKHIGGLWKFKAIGYDETGACIPGAGPLTDRHNTVFERLDPTDISRVLG